MNRYQRLFLIQAKADMVVFDRLRKDSSLPRCHALHYLQMATELLGKAHAWKNGPRTNTHRAFVGFLRSLATNRTAQNRLGYEGKNANWRHLIRKSVPLAENIEDLAPALALDGPNPEYPWPRADPHTAPAEHSFPIWSELQGAINGQNFLYLVRKLFILAEEFL